MVWEKEGTEAVPSTPQAACVWWWCWWGWADVLPLRRMQGKCNPQGESGENRRRRGSAALATLPLAVGPVVGGAKRRPRLLFCGELPTSKSHAARRHPRPLPSFPLQRSVPAPGTTTSSTSAYPLKFAPADLPLSPYLVIHLH